MFYKCTILGQVCYVFIFYDVNKPHLKLDWEVNEISTNVWTAVVNLLLLSTTLKYLSWCKSFIIVGELHLSVDIYIILEIIIYQFM